jgi:myo-inositol catabolism protein IolS
MFKVKLGRTGVEVPAISLGTWGHGGLNVIAGKFSTGWAGHDDTLALGALKRANELGITHWDTADVYGSGRAEQLIGTLWGEIPRDRIFLATKVGWARGPGGQFYEPPHMRSQMESSLRNLKTDVIDLYYLHHCNFGQNDEYFDDALAEVLRFRDEGKIRFVGLSDWNLGKIMKFIDRVDPDVVQPYRNAMDDDWIASGLADWIAKHDAGVAFFSPLKHGLLLGKYDRPPRFPEGDHRRNVKDFEDPAIIRAMQAARVKLEERFAARPQPVLHSLLGALLPDAPTGCVLLGMRTPAHVESAASFDAPLSKEEAEFVQRLYR